MTQTEDLVRSTTHALAETVRAVRPLPPLPQALPLDEPARGRGPRWAGWGGWAGWLVPLTAAAAMTAVVVGLVVVRGEVSGAGRGPTPAAGATVPEYYVTLHQTSATSAASLVVGDTRTGKEVAVAPAPSDGTFIGVTGAADDRTFVADAVHGTVGPGSNARPRTWYLLRIFPGSRPLVRLTPLPIPATAEQTVVHGIALSPDGAWLAVALRPDEKNDPSGPDELRVYSVATGRVIRSWSAPADSTVIPDGSGGIDSDTSLTWLDDGHTLALQSTSPTNSGDVTTIRTVDLSRPGTNLIASSLVVWSSVSPYNYSVSGPAPKCLSNGLVLLSGDGKTVICGRIVPALTLRNVPNQPCVPGVLPGTAELAEYSVATGRLLRTLATYPSSCATGGLEVYPLWASSAGDEVIGYLNTLARTATGQEIPGVVRFGVFGAGAFRPLPYPSLPSGVSLPNHIAW